MPREELPNVCYYISTLVEDIPNPIHDCANVAVAGTPECYNNYGNDEKGDKASDDSHIGESF